ncbi:unnamed protein product [Linum trigynum]|uniref:Isopenicillin N synthase-like Fe(2+) 2OG dioxygenase domain-containing protein n=1 Tax=Linum trigynum TaxID=586398 RepID=A0AAV2FN38_9ROSI
MRGEVETVKGELSDFAVRGALVVNIGDLLQIMSNDEYKSVEHRVLANPSMEPRVSVAVFFNSDEQETVLGPIPELISPEKGSSPKSWISEPSPISTSCKKKKKTGASDRLYLARKRWCALVQSSVSSYISGTNSAY